LNLVVTQNQARRNYIIKTETFKTLPRFYFLFRHIFSRV
jgi:hypothetical protein